MNDETDTSVAPKGAATEALPDPEAPQTVAASEREAAPAPEAALPADTPAAAPAPAPPPRRRRPSRRFWRWVANILIIGGVCLLAYPLGTWTYTWYEQRQLRGQLEQENPQLAAAVDAALTATDLVDVSPDLSGSPPTTATTLTTVTTTPGSAQPPPTTTTLSPAEERRLAELAAFRKAADDFERAIGKKTGEPIGRLLIPSIGLDKVILEGAEKNDLREGPGHWPETPFPGQVGNFIISGHRTTYGAPFLKLHKIEVGDEITVVLPYAIARYVVTETKIVGPKDMESVAQLDKEQISLAACHPIASATQRIVVQADMVGFKLIQQ